MTLDVFCALVAQKRLKSNLSSAVRTVILIYFHALTSLRFEDGEVFSSDIKDIGLQFRQPNITPLPVTFLQAVLQKFAIIESRAE